LAASALLCDVRAVFFDAVGTLLHPEPSAAEVYAIVGQRFGSRLSAAEIAPRFAAAFRRQEEFDADLLWRTTEAREVARWQTIVGEVLDDVSDPRGCFAELFAHFSRSTAWRLEPDGGRIIARIAAQGFTLGIASNYDQRLRSVVRGVPELSPIAHLVISAEIGWRKPAPAFFAAMCRALSLPPDRLLLVGDDLENDYEGARQAGFRTVLFDPNCRAAPGVSRIASLAELLG
jgi:putative hydrolase of the HAD superfamily